MSLCLKWKWASFLEELCVKPHFSIKAEDVEKDIQLCVVTELDGNKNDYFQLLGNCSNALL